MIERPKIPRNVIIIAFVALASGFGQDLITPVLPAYLTLIGVSAAGIGLIDGLLQGATSLFRFVSGILSDRYRNRKGLVFFGYALSSLARPLLALAGTFGSVAALRFADGVGKGTKDAPRDALVAASSPAGEHGRAFGFHRLVDTAGSVLGPLVAAGLLLFLTPSLATYRLIFLLAVIPGAVALGLIWFGVREPAPVQEAAAGTGRLPWVFWLFTAAVTLAMLTKVNDSLFLVRAALLGIPKPWIPVLFAGFTLVYALASYPIGIWSDRVGKMPLMLAGWIILGGVELGFAKTVPLAGALALFALYGLFYALTEGTGRAFIADAVPPAAHGRAFAVYYTLTGIAVIAGGWGLGRLWDTISPAATFHLAAAGSFAAALIFAIAWLTVRHRPLASRGG